MDPKKRFDFGASVGRDELGEVHRAESALGGPPLAVKCFDDWAVTSVEASGRLAERMQGLAGAGVRRTPPVVDWWLGGGAGWLATGWVEGRSLAARLAEEGPMGVEAALSLAAGILDALDELHGIGGAHGGLTPRKVITVGGEDGSSVVLTDPYQFELYAVTDPIRTSRSEPERYVGLPQYFSPEQAQGQRPDIRSDLYVVGLIIYEMIAGKPPFQSNAVHTTLRRQIYEKPLPLRLARPGLEVDSGLEDLLQSVLAKEVGNRFDTAVAFRRALEAVGAVSGPDAPSEPLGDLPARAAELRESLLGAGAAASVSEPGQESGAAAPGPARSEDGADAAAEDSGTAAASPESTDADAETGTEPSGSDGAEPDGSAHATADEATADDHSDSDDAPDQEPSSRSSRKRTRKGKRKRKGAREEDSGESSAAASGVASADVEPPREPVDSSGSSADDDDEVSGGSMTSGAWFAVGDDDEKLREHHTQRIVLETPVTDSSRLNRRFFAVMFVVLVVVVGGIVYLTNRPGDEAEEPARAEAPSPPAPSTPPDPPAPEAPEEAPEEAPAEAAVPTAVAEASRAVADASAEPVDGDPVDGDPVDGDPFDEVDPGVEEAGPDETELPEAATSAAEDEAAPAEAERRERAAEPARPEEPATAPSPAPRIEVAEAEEPAEPEVDSSRDDARRLVRDGQRSLEGRDLGAARRAFEGAIEADERNAAAHAGLGDVFFAERNYSEAARHHRRATRLAPRNAEYHRKLGQDFFRLNMFERALESFERAVELGDEGSQRFADIARDRAGSGD